MRHTLHPPKRKPNHCLPTRQEGQHPGLEGLAGGPDSPISQGNEGGDLPDHCVLRGGAPGADGPWRSWPGSAGQVAVTRRPAGTPPPASTLRPTALPHSAGALGPACHCKTFRGADCGLCWNLRPYSPEAGVTEQIRPSYIQGPRPRPGRGARRDSPCRPGRVDTTGHTSGCSLPGCLTLSSSPRAPGVPLKTGSTSQIRSSSRHLGLATLGCAPTPTVR